MALRRFPGVFLSMTLMPVGRMGMMSGLFVILRFVMLCRSAVVLRCVFVMFSRFTMMLRRFLRHSKLSPYVGS
jgi:hypothetical protein